MMMMKKLMLSIFTALLLCLQTCTGDKSCEIWSSVGRVVQRTSTFRVYCTFKFKCRHSMFSGHPPITQNHREHNSTTIYLDVFNLTEDRTFSCDCVNTNSNTENKPDSCGLDISAGYPPDQPTNFSCVYHISETNLSSVVACSWASGQKTYIRNTEQKLWIKTFTHNASGGSKSFSVSAKGSSTVKANFTVDDSVQVISVRASVTNPLGSAETPQTNYTLSDIVKPPAPVLHQVGCSSRNCSIKVKQSVPTDHLDINYKEDGEEHRTLHPNLVMANGSVFVQSLQPYRLYHFRARSRFRTGLWSDWSRTVSRWTQEEAPARALDTWYAVDHNSMRVYWKKLEIPAAQGKILDYNITVYRQNSTRTLNESSDKQSFSVPFCLNCHITVSARNTRGHSPPSNVTIHITKAGPLLVPEVNHKNVTISWRQHVIALRPLEYVVEWFPKGQKLDGFQWVRMGRNSSHIIITDMEPFVCYEGAVYVFYGKNSVDRLGFTDINTAVMVPTAGPFIEERSEGTTVNVTWSELPTSQRGGCITKYTLYLKDGSRYVRAYNVSASQRFLVLRGLAPASYSIWMTASTAKGESKPGPKISFFIQQDSQVVLVITFALLFFLVMFLLCACQMSAVKERLWVYFQYCMPDIPDPANSKWAKDCLKEKGKVNPHLQLSTSTVSEEEEGLVFVDIQELPRHLLFPKTSLSSDSEPSTPLYPHITYIKSFSHDSDSSGHTQTSCLDTKETVDYISSHETAAMSEEEEDNENLLAFFPSHSFSLEQFDFGPKLTLDAVRIDGTDFFLPVASDLNCR